MTATHRRFLGLVILALSAYWLVVVAAMHVLEPEFAPLEATLSFYVLGSYGSWMTTTFFAAGAAGLGIAYGLWSSLPRGARSTVAFACSVVGGLAVIILGLFPTDGLRPPQTLASNVHDIAGLTRAVASPTAALLFSLAFRGHRDWQSKAATGLVLALLTYVLHAMVVFGLAFPSVFPFPGLAQRLSAAVQTAWSVMAVVPMLGAWRAVAEPRVTAPTPR